MGSQFSKGKPTKPNAEHMQMLQDVENLTRLLVTTLTLRRCIWPIIWLGEKQKTKSHLKNNGTTCCCSKLWNYSQGLTVAGMSEVVQWKLPFISEIKSLLLYVTLMHTGIDIAVWISFLSLVSLQNSWCVSVLLTPFSPPSLFQKYITRGLIWHGIKQIIWSIPYRELAIFKLRFSRFILRFVSISSCNANMYF